MIQPYYCGECRGECIPIVERDGRNRPIDVRSDCCGDDVFRTEYLSGAVDVSDYDPDFHPFLLWR